ncbi:MAG: hypothetical protein GY760_02365 [Deltaproteobacteria bacterium]|nr:hypothetical protein [Deltaproteobacteria bacterium]
MIKKISIIIYILLIASISFGKSGPEIPIPQVSINEAISLAKNLFYSSTTKLADESYFKKDEYILISVEYTNDFEDKVIWAWKALFVHPKQNDHSAAFRIVSKSDIQLLSISE